MVRTASDLIAVCGTCSDNPDNRPQKRSHAGNVMNGMYPDTKTWNPFAGCRYDCVYCEKSFKRQLKRVGRGPDVCQGSVNPFNASIGLKGGCTFCYTYEPHYHPERLGSIPNSPIVFVYGTGDITFCDLNFVRRTFAAIDNHKPRMVKTYYFQSKNPVCFNQYLGWFKAHQDIVILLTTLETNRDEGYREISRAPLPTIRFKDFYELDYPRKVLTIEPVLDFDLDAFVEMVLKLHMQGTLEYVWFGYDSKRCGLPEPSIKKAQEFVDLLQLHGIEVRGKTLRGVEIEKEVLPFNREVFGRLIGKSMEEVINEVGEYSHPPEELGELIFDNFLGRLGNSGCKPSGGGWWRTQWDDEKLHITAPDGSYMGSIGPDAHATGGSRNGDTMESLV
jgi:hypothetical protein